MTAPGYGTDDTASLAAVAARRRAQRSTAMAGGVTPPTVRAALGAADALRDRYRQGGQGAPTLTDVVTAYSAVARGE